MTDMIRKMIIDQGYNDINPIDCGTEICAKNHSFGPAVRNNWLLHFVVSGKGIFRTKRGESCVEKDHVFIIKPYEITYYEADESNPWEYVWIGFTSKIRLPSLLLNNDVIYAPYLHQSFKDMIGYDDSVGNSRGFEDILCSKIWEIISYLRREEEYSGKSAELYVRRALNIIEAEYHNGIDVTEIAKRLNLNRSYFTTAFNSVMKISPGAYLTKFRMERAARMLKSKFYNVSIVASSVGFSDVFSFSRAFKAHFGISPRKYIST